MDHQKHRPLGFTRPKLCTPGRKEAERSSCQFWEQPQHRVGLPQSCEGAAAARVLPVRTQVGPVCAHRVQAMAEAADPGVTGCRVGCHQGTGELKNTCVTVRHRSQPEGGALSYRALRTGAELAISVFCLSKKQNRTHNYAT